MRRSSFVIAGIVILAPASWALPEFLEPFTTRYDAAASKLNSCQVCHMSGTGFNAYGADVEAEFKNNGEDLQAALSAVEPRDSDGDGFSNLEEIRAGRWPGDPADFPTAIEALTWSAIKAKYTTLP